MYPMYRHPLAVAPLETEKERYLSGSVLWHGLVRRVQHAWWQPHLLGREPSEPGAGTVPAVSWIQTLSHTRRPLATACNGSQDTRTAQSPTQAPSLRKLLVRDAVASCGSRRVKFTPLCTFRHWRASHEYCRAIALHTGTLISEEALVAVACLKFLGCLWTVDLTSRQEGDRSSHLHHFRPRRTSTRRGTFLSLLVSFPFFSSPLRAPFHSTPLHCGSPTASVLLTIRT